MALALYDPSSVIMLIAGIAIDDVVDGTFIRITKDEQTFTSSKSTDGQVYRRKNTDNTYTIELTLTSSSRTSRILQYLLIADQTLGVVKFPVFIKDISGSSFFFATTCWIENQPDMSFSNQVLPRPWIIKATECTINYGDNYGPSSFGEDALNTLLTNVPSLKGFL